MCTSKKAPKDNSAEINRQLEAERQAKIAAEVGQINTAFSGYDDPYYEGVSKAYTDHYTPELSNQYQKAREQLIYSNPGGGAGSAFNRSVADLDSEYSTQQADLLNKAGSFASDYRNNVEGERSSLMNMASLNAGSGAAAAQAVNAAKSLATPPAYSALGDLFSRITGNLATVDAAKDKATANRFVTDQLNFSKAGKGSTVFYG
jgi:hypothetical protein